MTRLPRALTAAALAAHLAAALGCGSSSRPPAQAADGNEESTASAPSAGAPGAPGAEEGPPGAPLDAAECDQLADHLVEVSMAARRPPASPAGGSATAPGDAFTAEDAEAAKKELRQSLRPACAQLPRRDFRCAMAARTAAELGACQQ